MSKQDAYEYRCSNKICRNCSLMMQCTKSKDSRTLTRHYRKDDLDKMRNAAESSTAKRDIRTRQYLMERFFARATRYGFKRATFRRLWRIQIQEYLTAAIQNITVLLSYGKNCGLAKVCSLSFVQKLSSGLHFLFVRIRNTIYSLHNNFFYA